MIGHRHRLDQRAEFQRQVGGQLVQHVGGYHGVLGHPAVGHQPVEADLCAGVVMPARAAVACAAGVDGLHRNPVTDVESLDIRTDFGDGPGELVTEDQRCLLPGQRVGSGGMLRGAGIVFVEIGPADPVEAHLDLDLAGRWCGFVGIDDLDVLLSVEHCRAHDVFLRFDSW